MYGEDTNTNTISNAPTPPDEPTEPQEPNTEPSPEEPLPDPTGKTLDQLMRELEEKEKEKSADSPPKAAEQNSGETKPQDKGNGGGKKKPRFTVEIEDDKKAFTPPPEAPAVKQEATPQPAAAASLPQDPIEAELNEDEQDWLSVIRYAEQTGEEKYAGAGKKAIDFLKARKDFVENVASKYMDPKSEDYDPSYSMTEDPDYKKVVGKYELSISPREIKRLEQQKLKAEVAAEIRENDLKRVYDDVNKAIVAPQAEKEVDAFRAELESAVLPEEVKKIIQSDGIQKAREEYEVELTIASGAIQEGVRAAKLFTDLSTGLVSYDEKNPEHKNILEFIYAREKELIATKDDKLLVQNGKKFATRSEFGRMTPVEKEKHFVLRNKDILGMMRIFIGDRTKAVIEEERKRIERYAEKRGFKKADAAPVPTPAPKETPKASAPPPAPRAAARAGASVLPPPSKERTVTDIIYGDR